MIEPCVGSTLSFLIWWPFYLVSRSCVTLVCNHHHHHQFFHREGRWGNTDDFSIIFLHFYLFSTAFWDLSNSGPVHFLMLSSHLFLCLPCSLFPFHCALQEGFGQTWWTGNITIPLHFTMVRRSSCGPIAGWILAWTSLLVTWSLCEMSSILQQHLISMACILLWSSAVRVHDSQAYGKMDVTRERISHILELREILLSIQTGFSRVNAALVCAILESISSLEPSSDITEPRYLKFVTVSSFCPFTLTSFPKKGWWWKHLNPTYFWPHTSQSPSAVDNQREEQGTISNCFGRMKRYSPLHHYSYGIKTFLTLVVQMYWVAPSLQLL